MDIQANTKFIQSIPVGTVVSVKFTESRETYTLIGKIMPVYQFDEFGQTLDDAGNGTAVAGLEVIDDGGYPLKLCKDSGLMCTNIRLTDTVVIAKSAAKLAKKFLSLTRKVK